MAHTRAKLNCQPLPPIAGLRGLGPPERNRGLWGRWPKATDHTSPLKLGLDQSLRLVLDVDGDLR